MCTSVNIRVLKRMHIYHEWDRRKSQFKYNNCIQESRKKPVQHQKFDTILRNTAPITRSWQLSKVVICKLIKIYMYRHFIASCYARVTKD